MNVHALTLNHRLPNGNDSGIRVVMRDDRGTIIKMYSGSIRNLTMIGNELWSMVVGLREGFLEQEDRVELKNDKPDGVKEWED